MRKTRVFQKDDQGSPGMTVVRQPREPLIQPGAGKPQAQGVKFSRR